MSYSDTHSFLYNSPPRTKKQANMSPPSNSFDSKTSLSDWWSHIILFGHKSSPQILDKSFNNMRNIQLITRTSAVTEESERNMRIIVYHRTRSCVLRATLSPGSPPEMLYSLFVLLRSKNVKDSSICSTKDYSPLIWWHKLMQLVK